MPAKFTQEEACRKIREAGLEPLERYNNRNTKMLLKCKCGGVFSALPGNVFTGSTTSCGCLNIEALKNRKASQEEASDKLKTFGMGLAGEYSSIGSKALIRCRCGDLFRARLSSVFAGNTKSCGCLSKNRPNPNVLPSDEVDRRLERLGLKRADHYNNQSEKMSIVCHCGTSFTTILRSVFSGMTKSCGCIGISAGEHHIKRCLEKWGHSFMREWTRENKRTRSSLRYDFYLPKQNALIEFNGIQHFEISRWDSDKGRAHCEERLTKIQAHDKEKRDWAAANGIPLLDINYDEVDQVEDKVWNFLMELRSRKLEKTA